MVESDSSDARITQSHRPEGSTVDQFDREVGVRTLILNLLEHEYDVLEKAEKGPETGDRDQLASLAHAILDMADAE